MNAGDIAGKSNPGGQGTNVGIWTGRKRKINAEVAEIAEFAEKSGGREKEIPQPQTGQAGRQAGR
jgi:hypothetical protein